MNNVIKESELAKWLDLDAVSRGCETQLERTQGLIDSDAFSRSLDSVIDGAKQKLNSK